jgi:oligoendopeptidase F
LEERKVETLLKRSEIAQEDTWDLTALFASDEDWQQAWEKLNQACIKYEKFKGHLGDSPQTLYECLCFDDELCEALDKVYSYAAQKQDQDTSDSYYQELYGKAVDLLTKVQTACAFISVEITELGKENLEKMMQQEPKLLQYKRAFDIILQKEAYTLSGPEEQILAQSSLMAGAASDVFKMFNNADIKFDVAIDETGSQIPVTHGNFVHLLESSDRTLRESAYQSVYRSYGNYKNTLAAMYQSRLKEFSFYAKVRGYASPMAYALFNNEIPLEVYDNLIEAVHDALPVMYRYVALRKKLLGVEQLHMYDVYVPLVKDFDKKYSFEEAKAIVKKALAPMGKEYLTIVDQAFENRWIDIYENEGKRTGAYSTCCYGVHPYMLLNYNGSLNHVFTLAHEMGHSIHSWYSNQNQPFTYAYYKIFVAEVASTCNEALLNHYLLENAKSKEEKAYIINNFLDSFKGTIFRQTMFAEFEKQTHQMVWDGQVLTAAKLCEIYHKLNELYFGPDMEVDHYIDMEWARIPHFYTPFYVYQYATGFSAAIALSSRILEKGEEAVKEYIDFLSGGCSTDPISLLKIAGVDMTTKSPIQSAMNTFSALVDQMEALLA